MRADKEKTARLLKTARGQIDGVLKMIEEDRYCIDISNQLLAAGAVLKKANSEILRAHLNGCVSETFGEEAGEKLSEITGILERLIND